MAFEQQSGRREFLQNIGRVAGATAMFSSIAPANNGVLAAESQTAPTPDLVVTHGEDPKALVRAAIESLGGMKRFVSKGDVVVVKPNIGWDRLPRQAANTSPDAVAALVEMAVEAGAKQVKVFDNPIATPNAAYSRSGIADAARKAGATAKFLDERFFKQVDIKGEFLKRWPVYMEAIECNCFINVPIAKHHSASRLSMALKNHMGIIGGARGDWHRSLDVALAEFCAYIKPYVKLTVLDAYRIMVRNGPTGGSLADVQIAKKCVAGVDQVAVDAYGATLFKTPGGAPMKPTDLGYLVKAKEMGLGEIDLQKLTIKTVEVT